MGEENRLHDGISDYDRHLRGVARHNYDAVKALDAYSSNYSPETYQCNAKHCVRTVLEMLKKTGSGDVAEAFRSAQTKLRFRYT